MKRLLAFLLYIYMFNKIESYVVETDFLSLQPNPNISITSRGVYKDEHGVKIKRFRTAISKPIDSTADLQLLFTYYDQSNERLFDYSTTLCSADYSNFEGTVAALVAQAWGIINNPICPTNQSTYKSESIFEVEDANFGKFAPKSGFIILKVKGANKKLIITLRIYDDDTWEAQNS